MKNLPTDYQTFIATSRYARWIDSENRRESWEETVDRFMENVVYPKMPETEEAVDINIALKKSILNLEIMPSMRAMMTAGKALERDNTCAYNCSYLPVDDMKSFDEAMFILMCGTGVGFSVERQYVSKLPEVPEKMFDSNTIIAVSDSKEGWAKALRQLISLLYSGEIPKWDMSKIRPAGSRLKVFGGRASGPEPLDQLFRFVTSIFKNASGRKLNSLECHDIMCKIGEVVVVGGVRRSAMISLSNLSDDRMRNAKTGQFWETNPQRSLANNSVAYTEKPDASTFLHEWASLVDSGTGERGMFSRIAAQNHTSKNGRRDYNHEFGTNPCSEIILRPYQFCNLTEVVVRADDSLVELERKVKLATILGTVQATYTHFPYLRKIWAKNTEEERLLGVSLTGIMDHDILNGINPLGNLPAALTALKQAAIETNKIWADKLGIPVSTAITCVKPSGTVSQLVDSASGIHPRHNPYYIRRVRGDNKDPITQFMKDMEIPHEPDIMKPDNTTVFSFPVKAPDTAITRHDISATVHLHLWKIYAEFWCEHKPSITVSVKPDEWISVGSWLYDNFNIASGLSFLPHSDHIYKQAPYEDCTEEEYHNLLKQMPDTIDWSKLSDYEKEDTTKASQSLACTAGVCEIVDIT
jgi:ribonucleoside-diphosphate reductase alpha chain